jgi:hypothetical protein
LSSRSMTVPASSTSSSRFEKGRAQQGLEEETGDGDEVGGDE